MTRGKWVALAVGLAVIAVLVHYGPAMWRAVRYQKVRVWGVQVDPDVQPECVVYMVRRFIWDPGPKFTQLCTGCAESRHVGCPRRIGIFLNTEGKGGVPVHYTYSCDCPHSSHAQDSE